MDTPRGGLSAGSGDYGRQSGLIGHSGRHRRCQYVDRRRAINLVNLNNAA